MALKDDVLRQLHQQCGDLKRIYRERSVYRVNQYRVNIRTATEKRHDDKFWFDVTPSYYEDKDRLVDFFVYACGSPSEIYIFPADVMKNLIQQASLGGQKQVPNFTIDRAHHEFEPAGSGDSRQDIQKYRNYFEQLS